MNSLGFTAISLDLMDSELIGQFSDKQFHGLLSLLYQLTLKACKTIFIVFLVHQTTELDTVGLFAIS